MFYTWRRSKVERSVCTTSESECNNYFTSTHWKWRTICHWVVPTLVFVFTHTFTPYLWCSLSDQSFHLSIFPSFHLSIFPSLCFEQTSKDTTTQDQHHEQFPNPGPPTRKWHHSKGLLFPQQLSIPLMAINPMNQSLNMILPFWWVREMHTSASRELVFNPNLRPP